MEYFFLLMVGNVITGCSVAAMVSGAWESYKCPVTGSQVKVGSAVMHLANYSPCR